MTNVWLVTQSLDAHTQSVMPGSLVSDGPVTSVISILIIFKFLHTVSPVVVVVEQLFKYFLKRFLSTCSSEDANALEGYNHKCPYNIHNITTCNLQVLSFRTLLTFQLCSFKKKYILLGIQNLRFQRVYFCCQMSLYRQGILNNQNIN